jgi:hypothetical protein
VLPVVVFEDAQPTKAAKEISVSLCMRHLRERVKRRRYEFAKLLSSAASRGGLDGRSKAAPIGCSPSDARRHARGEEAR